MTTVLTCLLSIALPLLQPVTPADPPFESALGIAGLNTRSARFDENLLPFFARGEFTTPLYRLLSADPWQTPHVMDAARRDLAGSAGAPAGALMTGTRLVGYGTRRTLLGNPNAADEESAKKAGSLGATLDVLAKQGALSGAVPALDGVPAEVQEAAALVLTVALRAREFRRLAFRSAGDLEPVYASLRTPPADNDLAATDAYLTLARQTNLSFLAAGAHDLALAAQTASARLASVPADRRFRIRFATVWGEVVLSGGTDDRYEDPNTFLVIDTGGKDTYVNIPANGSARNWASVVLDRAGDDLYLSDPALATTPVAKWDGRKGGGNLPGPGGALLGYSVLIDATGDDRYVTHRPGLGSGLLGFGILLDEGGTDRYDAYQNSQGYGAFGGGILEDAAGDDVYEGFSQVQGMGQTAGFGYLIDRAGNDRYVANDEVIDVPSPQSAQHNVSMAQGAGNGRRADYSDNQSLSGGLGILFDLGGNDSYSAGVFAQGVGYWQGIGALWDVAGDDRYLAQWYAQGASAHFAIGYLEDGDGNDRYGAPMNMAMGAGHDFGYGMLLERAGNDVYQAPNLSLGAGNANGLGMFVDFAGDDGYEATGLTLGRGAEAPANSLRSRGLCLGVFIDLGGTDRYPTGVAYAKNGDRVPTVTTRGPSMAQSQLGVFWDR